MVVKVKQDRCETYVEGVHLVYGANLEGTRASGVPCRAR